MWPTVKVIFVNENKSKIEVKILSAKIASKNFTKSWGVEEHKAFSSVLILMYLLKKHSCLEKDLCQAIWFFRNLSQMIINWLIRTS